MRVPDGDEFFLVRAQLQQTTDLRISSSAGTPTLTRFPATRRRSPRVATAMGQPSFAASNAVIYLTYGLFL